jgi:hypothetical protein
VSALRGFVGLTNYYSAYMPYYAQAASPLTNKLKVKCEDGKKGSRKRVSLKEEDIAAFDAMKGKMLHEMELFRADPDEPFIHRADASDKAIGAVREQMHPEGTGPYGTVPLGFFSRQLSKHQLNSTPREKETYVVV